MSEIEHNPHETPKAENEIADYYEGMRALEMRGHESGIRKARNALFVTAGLILLGEVISASLAHLEFTPLLIGIIAIEVGIFVALALWTKTKPYTATIVGIIAIIGLWIFSIVSLGAEAAYKGVLVKIIILATLFSALKSAKAWEEGKKESR